MSVERNYLGDTRIMWTWGSEIDPEISARALGFYRMLKADARLKELGVLDVVPAYTSVAVYHNAEADVEAIVCRTDSLLSRSPSETFSEQTSRPFRFPAVYDGADLGRVTELTGISTDAVIELHTGSEYTVAMIGFLPNFPYLIGMDSRLATSRLPSPRKKVPAGSVAIGGAQTGIYPVESPGGWNIVGRTLVKQLAQIRPGDRIIFEPVEELPCE